VADSIPVAAGKYFFSELRITTAITEIEIKASLKKFREAFFE
jgi:hypothetical protein